MVIGLAAARIDVATAPVDIASTWINIITAARIRFGLFLFDFRAFTVIAYRFIFH